MAVSKARVRQLEKVWDKIFPAPYESPVVMRITLAGAEPTEDEQRQIDSAECDLLIIRPVIDPPDWPVDEIPESISAEATSDAPESDHHTKATAATDDDPYERLFASMRLDELVAYNRNQLPDYAKQLLDQQISAIHESLWRKHNADQDNSSAAAVIEHASLEHGR